MSVPQIVDSHCHLDFDTFEKERDEVIARARRAGVCRMVTISTRISTFPKIRAIAEQYDDVFCSVGIHPQQAGEEEPVSVAELVDLAAHPKVVGIGESGLDYFYDSAPRDRQSASFRTHIQAAQETGLPLIVHARDADEDVATLLEEEYARKPYKGVLHCFSSGRRLAERALDIGFYVSLSGILTFKNAEDIRATVRDVPMERLLVETDSPYLAPIPKRGKRNEPAYVAFTHAALAELRGVDEEEMARNTTRNFFRLFDKVTVPDGLDLTEAA